MLGMICYRKAAVERAMKVQEVILRAMAKKITWWQAAEIIGISDRQMRQGHWAVVDLIGKGGPEALPINSSAHRAATDALGNLRRQSRDNSLTAFHASHRFPCAP